MTDVFEEYGDDKKLDVILNSPWKDYTDILEEEFKSQGFIKISKKGLKTMTTVPLLLQLQAGDEWKQIREGIISVKADIDFNIKKDGKLEYKPDIGIKKLIFVADEEEKVTE